jgi:hypothetical protein
MLDHNFRYVCFPTVKTVFTKVKKSTTVTTVLIMAEQIMFFQMLEGQT